MTQSDFEIVRGALKTALGAETFSTKAAVEVFTDALEALSRIEAATQWRDIQSAPKDGTWILAYDKSGLSDAGWVTIIYFDDANGIWLDQSGDLYTPTHWMPLPSVPDMDGAE